MATTAIATATIITFILLYNQHSRRKYAEIERHYLQMLLWGDIHSERYIKELAHCASTRTKMIAAEVVANLTPIIYRLDTQYINSLTQDLHLSEFLLSQCQQSRGTTLIHNLATLSKIPITNIDINRLTPYLHSKNRMVRLFALAATINADREKILHHIANYPYILTPFERSQLLLILRQGSITIAYQPMLAHDNTNVKLLGIAIIRHFAIEDAEAALRDIIDVSNNHTLQVEALYTLASMQLLLCTPPIAQLVRSLSLVKHQQFLRYIAEEGYSQSVINFFTTRQEAQYFQSLINSYKVKIECL